MLRLRLASSLASLSAVAEIVVMGGAIYQPGNATAVATANIVGDPEACDVVYQVRCEGDAGGAGCVQQG